MFDQWPEVRAKIDAKSELARPWYFQWQGLTLYAGPMYQNSIGFFVKNLSLKMTPRMLALIEQYVRHHLKSVGYFGQITNIPAPSGGVLGSFEHIAIQTDFFVSFTTEAKRLPSGAVISCYHQALKMLALLGEYPGESLQAVCERTIPRLSPMLSGTQNSARGHLRSDVDTSCTGEILIERKKPRLFSLNLNVSLPINAAAFDFESTRFPFRYFDRVKVGDKLCDDTFYFSKSDDESLLKRWLELIKVLAIHDLDLEVSSKNRTLKIECDNVHLYALGPLLKCASEMWRSLCSQARGLSHEVVAPPPFASVNYVVPG